MTGEELFLNELNFHIRQGISKKDLTDLINERLKQLTLTNVIKRLPIGTKVNIVNKPEWGDEAGKEKTITGHCKYFGKDTGYLLDEEGIYLREDFEVNVL
tara:strand:- start:381 stop:680 length:300 start_codon:yes stop_codon:yes gene_type:complete